MSVFAAALENTVDGVATIKSLETVFSNVVQMATSLAVVTLFVMTLVGGFNFLFSGGDQKKLEQAKGTITAAVIGLAVIVLSYLILRLIGQITGVGDTITKFELQTQ